MTEKTKQDVFDFLHDILFNTEDFTSLYSISEMKLLAHNALDILKESYVVHCKDCNIKECFGRSGYVVCGKDGEPHGPQWFCADGERDDAVEFAKKFMSEDVHELAKQFRNIRMGGNSP